MGIPYEGELLALGMALLLSWGLTWTLKRGVIIYLKRNNPRRNLKTLSDQTWPAVIWRFFAAVVVLVATQQSWPENAALDWAVPGLTAAVLSPVIYAFVMGYVRKRWPAVAKVIKGY